jgi:putative hemolysin
MEQLADVRSHESSVSGKRRLSVTLAASEDEVLAAQKLRWRVFADEMGARLPSRTPGVDRDIYDPYCDHLIVRDEDSDRVIGTYRILPPDAARRIGGYYSEGEFDLTRLTHLRENLVEIGRSCIDADFRTGGVITLLWGGLARYMRQRGYEYLMGCASLGMRDGGHNAAGIYNALTEHMAPLEYRVFPRCPLPLAKLEPTPKPELPPLVKGYLRAGAWVCGEPAWDPDFNTADLLLLMPMSRVDNRYARHFVERQS